jgi:scyllo-inositol 2-dehydrogenase (NAD+)
MLNVAMLSKWHVHADDYARQVIQNEHLNIHVVWDEDEKRGEQWANELGVPFEKNLEKVLGDRSIDAVIVDSPTSAHKEIILRAAEHKKHIFTEKVLAFTVQDCEEIFNAVEENEVKLMVSLPRLTENYYLYAQEVLDRGLLGRLTSIRCRLAHNGTVPSDSSPNGWLPPHFLNKEKCGGGALIDLGAHPIYLLNRLAGRAKAITACLQHSSDHEVEDNAALLLEFEAGALGIIETSFVSGESPFQLELYGTHGTLLIEEGDIHLKANSFNEGWTTPTQLPEALPMPLEQWVQDMMGLTQPTIRETDIRDLTLINQAAILSQQERRKVETIEILNIKVKK